MEKGLEMLCPIGRPQAAYGYWAFEMLVGLNCAVSEKHTPNFKVLAWETNVKCLISNFYVDYMIEVLIF